MTAPRDVRLALALLREDPAVLADARIGAPRGNSIAGGVLTRPLGPIGSRQVAEAAVREAIRIIDEEARNA
jgi:hypothetical protein